MNPENFGACNFIKKEALAQVFSCEFCEISKNTFFFIEHLRWLLLEKWILYELLLSQIIPRKLNFAKSSQ